MGAIVNKKMFFRGNRFEPVGPFFTATQAGTGAGYAGKI
jgi:hypothetical protein